MERNKIDGKYRFLIQVIIVIGVTLIVQFLIPWSWLPFNAIVGDVFGSGMVTSLPIASMSTWIFAFSIAWFIFRDNSYINSFLVCAVFPLSVIVGIEFSFYRLVWDYIHVLPLIIGIYIIWKKRDTLIRRYILLFSGILVGIILLEYYIGVAYSAIPLLLLALLLPIFVLVTIQIEFLVTHQPHPKKKIIRRILKGFIYGLWIFGIFLGTVLIVWYLRPNTADIKNNIVMESWVAVTGQHNSNTDLIYWNKTGRIYLIHDRRPFHLGSTDARLILWSSLDARNWTKITEFSVPGNDIRDPKFAIIGNRLFLYALKNLGVMATPYQTVYTFSEDGINWQPFQEISLSGWLFWRPKTNDNLTWYVPAYWHEHGQSILLNSTDGINWNIVATIYTGEANDETAIEFLPDGRMICTARLEGTADSLFGSSEACTLIATSSYPYTNWSSYIKSRETRLDGPVLFSHANKIFAIGRRHLGPRTYFTELGSIFSRKRTAIYLVNETSGLRFLTDLPSAGDTSYAGIVIKGEELFISYYTSDITKDYSWILGMVANSDIRIAKINISALVMIS
ncbi:MAG: hypothetical protein ACTSYB_06280 [Candidatus Helarchaeota archaeon]